MSPKRKWLVRTVIAVAAVLLLGGAGFLWWFDGKVNRPARVALAGMETAPPGAERREAAKKLGISSRHARWPVRDRVLAKISELLTDGDPAVRAYASLALLGAENPPAAAIDTASELLFDNDLSARLLAYRALHQEYAGRGMEQVVTIRKQLTAPSVAERRKGLVAAVRNWIELEGLLPNIATLAADTDPGVRNAAFAVLLHNERFHRDRYLSALRAAFSGIPEDDPRRIQLINEMNLVLIP